MLCSFYVHQMLAKFFFAGILPSKRRSRESGIWTVCATRKYWWNITTYLFSEEWVNVYNHIGGKAWGCLDSTKGNIYKYSFNKYIHFFYKGDFNKESSWADAFDLLAICDDKDGSNSGDREHKNEQSAPSNSRRRKRKL